MLTPKRKGSDYHHGDLKSAAVLAARNLIQSGGQQALGIRRVAEKLGVTAPALYRHFTSLDELLYAVSCDVRAELGELMVTRRSEVHPSRNKRKYEIDKFRAIGDAYVDYAQKFPKLFEIAFIQKGEEPVGEYSELAWNILNESVENFVTLGITPKSKRATAPLVAWSAVHGLATLVANQSIASSDIPFFRESVMAGIEDSLLKKD